MTDEIEIDADLPDHQQFVKFRNVSDPCLIIRKDKAAGHAKNFREAASLLANSGDRGRKVADWLLDLAARYDSGFGMDQPSE